MADHIQAGPGKVQPGEKAGAAISDGRKITIHLISIFLPSFLFILPSLYSMFGSYGTSSRTEIRTLSFVLLLFGAYIAFLYWLAGGFDWSSAKVSSTRSLLFFLGSGIFIGLVLIGIWLLVRWVCALLFKVPLSSLRGKLLYR